jgi:hypothetical protein
MPPIVRWHLRNLGLVLLFMFGWAFLSESLSDFLNPAALLRRLGAWAFVAVIYLVAVYVFKLGPPDEKPGEPEDTGD